MTNPKPCGCSVKVNWQSPTIDLHDIKFIDVEWIFCPLHEAAESMEKALMETVGVLTEPGIMDVDEWKAWSKKAVFLGQKVLAKVGKGER